MPLYRIKYSVQTDNPEQCNPLFIMNSFMLEDQTCFIFLLRYGCRKKNPNKPAHEFFVCHSLDS